MKTLPSAAAPMTCDEIELVVASARAMRSEGLQTLLTAAIEGFKRSYAWLLASSQGLSTQHS